MIRDAETPTPMQLDQLATPTAGDVERARSAWRAALAVTPRRALATLLDASVEGDTGPATVPIPDEG